MTCRYLNGCIVVLTRGIWPVGACSQMLLLVLILFGRLSAYIFVSFALDGVGVVNMLSELSSAGVGSCL